MSSCCSMSNLISEKFPISYPLWLLYFNLFSFLFFLFLFSFFLKLCPGSNVDNYFATITSVIIFLHWCCKTDQCPNPYIPRLIILQSSHWKHLLSPSTTKARRLKHLPAMKETWVRSLGREDPLEKEMATHSSILAWRIPWSEELGGLQSMGSQRVGHDWGTSLSLSLSAHPTKEKNILKTSLWLSRYNIKRERGKK